MEDLVTIDTFNTRLEAQIVKGFFEANGIKSYISADDEGGAYPFPMQPTTTGVKLLVEKEDFKKASELLKKSYFK